MDIFVYVRGGDDLEFANYALPTTTALVSMLTGRSLGLEKPAPDNVRCVLGTNTVNLPDTTMKTFGESIQSFRAALKRSELLFNAFQITNAADTVATWYRNNFFIDPPTRSVAPGNIAAMPWTTMQLLIPCYLGIKGGTRYTMVPWQGYVTDARVVPNGRSDNLLNCYVQYLTNQRSIAQGLLWGTGGGQTTSFQTAYPVTSGAEVMSLRGNVIDFEIPDRSPGVYGYTGYVSQPVTGKNAGTQRAYTGAQVTMLAYPYTNGATVSHLYVDVFQSAADDYSLLGYIGPPIMYFTF